MTEISFSVPGLPRARQAHQFYRLKNRSGAVAVLPKESADYQTRVGCYAKEAMRGQPPIQGMVSLEVMFVFPAPQNLKKAQREVIQRGEPLPYAKIPQDIDNCCKNLLDGLKGVAIEDDRLVVDLYAGKRIGVKPLTMVKIRPITQTKESDHAE